MTSNNQFYMRGTEGTGEYIVVVTTGMGRVGFRQDQRFGSDFFRIRIEPTNREAGNKLRSSFPGYKEGFGGADYRFSTTCIGAGNAQDIVYNAVKALVPGGNMKVNPSAPGWAKHLVLVAEARQLGVRGVNRRWSVQTLQDKIAEITPVETEDQERQRLIATVRELKLPGANLASRWSLATLRLKAE